MKTRYLMIIIVLILVAVGFELLVSFSQLGEYPHLENAVPSAGIFVGLTAAVVALSAADPKEKLVKAKIEPSVDKVTGRYSKKQLSAKLKDSYQNLPDPIRSKKVQFKITNISGFSLRKPTLTFRLPLEKAHPSNGHNNAYYGRPFNSNLCNSQRELQLLESAATWILPNSNLPYWNDEDSMTIWIRMVLDDGKLELFIFEVSVNCEDAMNLSIRTLFFAKAIRNEKENKI